jgi:TonB family protein
VSTLSSFQRSLLYSLAGHLVLISVFLFWGPSRRSSRLPPAAISVNLVASVPSVAKPKPKPAPKPKPKPVPKPKPIPKPEPTPVAPTDTVVLPKDPKAPKPQPKPEPDEAPVDQVEYDDLMEQLRADAGEEFQDEQPPAENIEEQTAVPGVPGGQGQVSLEQATWNLAVVQHMRRIWVIPPDFQGSNLQVQVEGQIDAMGNIIGKIRVVRSSGNPYYDDSVLRALLKASPLPSPPSAGMYPFVFNAKEF